jgi:DNA modification methylase
VFRVGTADHALPLSIGRRHRSNVWDYAEVTRLRAGDGKDLSMRAVKPVALVAEAIEDCSTRGAIVLDPFGGAGTTLIAAEKTGRAARLIEFNSTSCDTILRRFEHVAGIQATHAASGATFAEVARERAPLKLSQRSSQ